MAKPSTATSRDDSTSSASPVSTSRPDPHPISTKSTSQSKAAGHPVSAAAAQFHRFRLTEFNRAENSSPTTSSAPAGQCSRFRVSDFVPSPWGNTSDTPSHTPTTPVAMSPVNGMMNGGRSASVNGAGGSPSSTAARQGSFSVMHMDVDGSGPQQTSTSVAAAAGSGRGVLQKIAVSPQQQQQQQQIIMAKSGANMQRPLAPSPMSAGGIKPFDPSTVPQEAVWELSRVLTIFRQLPADTVVKQITDALMQWPTLAEGSLLRRIGEVFPPPPPANSTNQNGNTAGQSQEPLRKKRGRPPGKKAKLNDGTSAPVPIAASPIGLQNMAPPPLPYAQPILAPAPIPSPVMLGPSVSSRGKNTADKLVQCTRCLKDFNPTWRATPASDPSSEATCAVKHQFKTFEQGLEAVTLPRRKNNYKTTWKWKCCGREVQSTSDQLLMWPRKEDDRTGGWCFVGKHTTELGVREKLGLKPGKGKKISEEIGKKRKKGSENKEVLAPGQANGNTMAAIAQSRDLEVAKANWALPENTDLSGVANGNLGYGLTQQQQSPPSGYPQTDSAPQSDDPPKRKRGRPKGSKTRSKIMQMTIPGSSTSKEQTVSSVPIIGVGVLQQNAGPEQQLMNEVQQHTHLQTAQNHDQVIGVGVVHDQNSFWTQYTEPNLDMEEQDPDDDDDDDGGDDGEGEDEDGSQDQEDNGEDPAISTADLSLLASATAAMSATQSQQLVEDIPEKRKRGRPKGSRNGKMPVETTQKALRMKPASTITSGDLAVAKAVASAAAVTKNIQPPPLQPDPAVTGTDEGAPFVGMGAMGAMDGYGGLGSGDGGGWFG